MSIKPPTRLRRTHPVTLLAPHKPKLRALLLRPPPPAHDLVAHNGPQLVPLAPARLQLQHDALHAARHRHRPVPRVADPQRLVALPVPPVGVAQRQRDLARRQRPRRQPAQRPAQPLRALQRVHLREDLRALGGPGRGGVVRGGGVPRRGGQGRVVEACGCQRVWWAGGGAAGLTPRRHAVVAAQPQPHRDVAARQRARLEPRRPAGAQQRRVDAPVVRVVRPVPEAVFADRRCAVALRQRVAEDERAELGWQD